MRQRRLTEKQIADLMQKATARPGEQDPMGMIGFGATTLAAKMSRWMLQADFEQARKKSN